MARGCQRRENPSKPTAGGLLMGCAIEPELAIANHGRHGLAAVAEGGFVFSALDERHNACVVGRGHSWSPNIDTMRSVS